ncbi:MAG: hypothetical protein VW891_14950 [Novosphingobium sp.]
MAPDLNAAAVAAHAAPAQPDALSITAAAVRAERDTRKAMKREDRYGELTPPSEPVDGATWVPNHPTAKPHYHTSIHLGTEQIDLQSYSDAEKDVAVELWKAVQRDNPVSLTNRKKRKAEREAANAEKRAKDVETHGDDCKRERDVLNANQRVLTADGVLDFRVLMLQTVADALVRIAAMPKGTYLRVQEKTTGNIQEHNGQRQYKFKKVTGYGTCLMVFQCQADNATFVAYGDDVDEAFKTRGSDHLNITISARNSKNKGWVKDEPILDCMPWLTYLGKGDEAYVNLQRWLVEQCEKKTPSLRINTSLPLCTIREANSELSKHHAKEESGIKAHILVEHGGIVPENDARWKKLRKHWRDNPHIYMLTEKRGDVVAYPEHSAQGKTDIYVYLKKYNYKRRQKWQYKTAGSPRGEKNGSHVNMCTANGRGIPDSNTYKDGDNDFYCAVRIDGNVVHYWTLTNAEMLKHKYIGEGAPNSFCVYTKDKPCAVVQEKGHAWTWEKHRSARIEYRDGLPVLAD